MYTGVAYVTLPVGCGGIGPDVVTRMLAGEDGMLAHPLSLADGVPYGARPVLVGETTVYSAVRVEEMVRGWSYLVPKPWIVLVPDAPVPTPRAARYRLRALGQRVAGMTTLRHMPALRAYETAEAAMADRRVRDQQTALIQALKGER